MTSRVVLYVLLLLPFLLSLACAIKDSAEARGLGAYARLSSTITSSTESYPVIMEEEVHENTDKTGLQQLLEDIKQQLLNWRNVRPDDRTQPPLASIQLPPSPTLPAPTPQTVQEAPKSEVNASKPKRSKRDIRKSFGTKDTNPGKRIQKRENPMMTLVPPSFHHPPVGQYMPNYISPTLPQSRSNFQFDFDAGLFPEDWIEHRMASQMGLEFSEKRLKALEEKMSKRRRDLKNKKKKTPNRSGSNSTGTGKAGDTLVAERKNKQTKTRRSLDADVDIKMPSASEPQTHREESTVPPREWRRGRFESSEEMPAAERARGRTLQRRTVEEGAKPGEPAFNYVIEETELNSPPLQMASGREKPIKQDRKTDQIMPSEGIYRDQRATDHEYLRPYNRENKRKLEEEVPRPERIEVYEIRPEKLSPTKADKYVEEIQKWSLPKQRKPNDIQNQYLLQVSGQESHLEPESGSNLGDKTTRRVYSPRIRRLSQDSTISSDPEPTLGQSTNLEEQFRLLEQMHKREKSGDLDPKSGVQYQAFSRKDLEKQLQKAPPHPEAGKSHSIDSSSQPLNFGGSAQSDGEGSGFTIESIFNFFRNPSQLMALGSLFSGDTKEQKSSILPAWIPGLKKYAIEVVGKQVQDQINRKIEEAARNHQQQTKFPLSDEDFEYVKVPRPTGAQESPVETTEEDPTTYTGPTKEELDEIESRPWVNTEHQPVKLLDPSLIDKHGLLVTPVEVNKRKFDAL